MSASRDILRRQSGFSMIEVLVTIIILLVGLLGLAGLMVQSQRSEMESYQRVQALVLLQDMGERVNANRNAASCYAFTTNATGTPYLGTGASAPTANIAGCKARATAFDNDDPSRGVISFCTPSGVCTSQCNPANACSTQALADSRATATARAGQSAPEALSDLQAWHNVLLGAAETSGSGGNVGAMVGARGCISYDAGTELLDKNGITVSGTGVYTIAIAWQGMGNTAIASPNCAQGQYGANDAGRRVVSLTLRTASLTTP